MLSISTFILFWTLIHLIWGQRCPPHEERVMCVDFCNTCESCTNNPPKCFPGCDCQAGYTRNKDGLCIPCELCEGTPKNCRCITVEQCDSTCKGEGYASGRCEGIFNLSCVCSNLSGLSIESFIYDTIGEDGCPDEAKCIATCRSRGFLKGNCKGRRKLKCKCSDPFPGDDTSITLPEEFVRICGCPNVIECSLNCRRRGHKRGVCQGDFCFCYPYSVGNDTSSGCPDEDKCLATCRTHGFLKGTCTNKGKQMCECSDPFPGDDTSIIPPEEVLQSCGCPNVKECSENCIRRGYKGGECKGDFCRCLPPFNSVIVSTPNGGFCPDESSCYRVCLRLGFKSGYCDGFKCSCLKVSPACFYFEYSGGKNCESGPCHRRCKKHGYRYGLCMDSGNICGCFRKVG